MANAFKNTTLVAKLFLKAFKNNLVLANKVDRQLDNSDKFASKVGDTIYIRRPVEFVTSTGEVIAAGDITDIEEATVGVQLDSWEKVTMAITQKQKTLNVEDAYNRYFMPAAKRLAQKVESKIAQAYTAIANHVGTPGTLPAVFNDIADASTKLEGLGVPKDYEWCAFWSPKAKQSLANGLKAVFPQKIATRAIEKASFGMYADFDNYVCQSIESHTVGTHGSGAAKGTPLVNGTAQNSAYSAVKDTWSQDLVTDGWTATQTGVLTVGDVITLADVYEVNLETKVSTGNLKQFTVNTAVNSDGSGDATINITPPIITTGPYQNVDAAPANNAAITVVSGVASTAYKQNLAWHRNAITLAFARIETPENDEGAKSSRIDYENISIGVTSQYNITYHRTIYRFDILFVVKVQNNEFAVRITE